MKKNWIHSEKRGSSDVFGLVDRKLHMTPSESGVHIICDIDKTYLETAFETFFQLASVAFQGADDKVSVQGAKYFLDALQWQSSDSSEKTPRGLHFISSSPPQLRRPISEKFSKDFIIWHSDTLKNQMYNLKKGRVDQLRHHIAYKNAAILDMIASFELKNTKLILIGDNAESDSYIYLGIAALLGGGFSVSDYRDYLNAVDVTRTHQQEILSIYDHIKDHKNLVDQILIRKAPGYKVYEDSYYNNWLVQFDDYLHLSFQMYFAGIFDLNNLKYVCKNFYHHCFFSSNKILSYALLFKEKQDITRWETMWKELQQLFNKQTTPKKDFSEIKNLDTDLRSFPSKLKDKFELSDFLEMARGLDVFVKDRRLKMKSRNQIK